MCEVSVDVLNWISAQCECTQDKGCLNLVWFGHIGNETIYCRQTDSWQLYEYTQAETKKMSFDSI